MAEAALLKATRALDQSGPETVVSKLQRLWDALAATSSSAEAGRFHAAEEVALRWLLKNMHAAVSGPTSPEVETLRRWPLTWRILACIFGRIPLFSLAKSLADRRFIAVLQQTAKDLATPTAAATSDQSSRKRKRWPDAQFDLASLREEQHCLVSAAALFEALRVLLSRLDDGLDSEAASLSSPFERMGAEHIKSFFSVPAADANVLLEPLLKTCRLALFTEAAVSTGDRAGAEGSRESSTSLSVTLDGQASWISTFATLWDLRLQGPNDAFDVSGRLASDGLTMLGRLLSISHASLRASTSQLDPHLQRRWSVGLQRFLTNNLVLPARSLFMNSKDVSAISVATSNATAKADAEGFVVRLTTFLYLALKAPRLLSGSGAASKASEAWLQTVFETIRESLMSTSAVSAQAKNVALAGLLDMAAENNMAPSIDSLEQVCEKCALKKDSLETDWRLLASVARCNADVFLLSEKGKSLLGNILSQLHATSTPPPARSSDTDSATSFLIFLAQGFAKNRDVPGFITHWFTGMCTLGDSLTSAVEGKQAAAAWLAKDLRAAVAARLQSSMTEEQLLSMIAQVENGTGALASSSDDDKANSTPRSVAQLVIFDALSASIHSEALENAVQTKLIDRVLGLALSSKLLPGILAIQWRLIRRTLAWVGFAEAERIWTAVNASLKSLSSGKGDGSRSSMLREDMFEALVASFSIWMALKFGGQAEKEARETTWALFTRVQEDLTSLTKDDSSKISSKSNESTGGLLQEVARQVAADNDTSPSFGGLFDTETSAAITYLRWMLCGSSRFLEYVLA